MYQQSLLEQVIATAPLLQQLIVDDCAIAICDREQLRGYFPGTKLNQNVNVGDPLIRNSGVGRAIATGKKITSRMGSELFGIPYVVVAIPIIEQGHGIVGGVSLSVSIEREERLFRIAQELHQYIDGVSSVIDELTNHSAELAYVENAWKATVNETITSTKRSGELSNSIKQISKETGILALNSGIEAARQGVNGRVFGVIATRMRELATDVNNTVEHIGDNLLSIEDASQNLQQQIQLLETISNQIDHTAKRLESQIKEVQTIIERIVEFRS